MRDAEKPQDRFFDDEGANKQRESDKVGVVDRQFGGFLEVLEGRLNQQQARMVQEAEGTIRSPQERETRGIRAKLEVITRAAFGITTILENLRWQGSVQSCKESSISSRETSPPAGLLQGHLSTPTSTPLLSLPLCNDLPEQTFTLYA